MRTYYNIGDKISGHLIIDKWREGPRNRYTVTLECKHCGELFTVPIRRAVKRAISCGCCTKPYVSKGTGDQNSNYRHGLSGSRVYRVWQNMKARCLNPDHMNYEYYGARGITIQQSWVKDFKAFYDYYLTLEGSEDRSLSLDRIDNDGNYEEGNIRLATLSQQQQNK